MNYELYAICALGLACAAFGFLVWRQSRKIKELMESTDALFDSHARYGRVMATFDERMDGIEREQKNTGYKLAILENHDNEHLEARAETDNEVDTLYGKLNLLDDRIGALEEEFESRVAQNMENEDEAMRKQARTFDSLQNLLDYSMDTAMKGKNNA